VFAALFVCSSLLNAFIIISKIEILLKSLAIAIEVTLPQIPVFKISPTVSKPTPKLAIIGVLAVNAISQFLYLVIPKTRLNGFLSW
jgi:hypothetical protein